MMIKTSFVFVFAVFLLALANAESVGHKYERFHSECHSAGALTPHVLCMNVKIGVMKSNGDIDTNDLKTALKVVQPTFTNASIDDAVAKCGERRGETAADAAIALNECLDKHLKRVPNANVENLMQKFRKIGKKCERANDITLCLMVRTGLMKPNGDIDRNDLREALKKVPIAPSALVDIIVADCGGRSGSTAAEAAVALNECAMKLLNPALHTHHVKE